MLPGRAAAPAAGRLRRSRRGRLSRRPLCDRAPLISAAAPALGRARGLIGARSAPAAALARRGVRRCRCGALAPTRALGRSRWRGLGRMRRPAGAQSALGCVSP